MCHWQLGPQSKCNHCTVILSWNRCFFLSASMFWHQGESRYLPQIRKSGTKSKKVTSLPDYYTNLAPASFERINSCPVSSDSTGHSQLVIPKHLSLDHEWLEKVRLSMDTHEAASLTWSAHHASKKRHARIRNKLVWNSVSVPRTCTFCCYDKALHGCGQVKHKFPEPWSSPSDSCWSATVCHS